ncbi:zinc knuckle domain protein [Colletotrichum tofieldiae]|nr:zinc knuckle domain protein [Colletotrichum tofieldiae]GKT91227.1 zinc knuckle domain protein [Colletotrichum tofieldiae]
MTDVSVSALDEGHMSRDCPEGPKDTKSCYRCGQAGHISRDCPQGGNVGGGGPSSSECYKVGRSAVESEPRLRC